MRDSASGPLRFDDQVVIVTGAGAGLGKAHADLLADRGAHVVVNDVGRTAQGRPAAEEVVEEIRARGGSSTADTSDISTKEGAEAVVASAVAAGGRLIAVVNNAGIVRDASFARMSAEEATRVVDVHLWGTFWVSQAAWPIFREQQAGRIVNTTSTAAYLGNFGQANYGAAKGGIIGLTKVLAIEGRQRNILVNSVAPAAATAMTDGLLGDLAERLSPERVSALVAYLAHPSCEVTGEVFHAGAGAVSRVFYSQTRGIFHDDLTPEHVRDEWARVMDDSDALPALGIQEELAIHDASAAHLQ
ncbi:SDR family NAD(P)-dependent oxidoreductase [Nocardioides sp. zg-ZUI104]|uniref:SDR family NAD(P)-dependent oxidoreductase n=1 Tax=Nocardioides faecalis TaxID=2803858 RepID=UPI001BCB549F|nr:SDR family NAD(P)-dependent oxidoreductase [Nocardioides faecalis]MBS4754544.1 SDR family NAD(P)-dependent oxidoreductase [Nocardioides faecalis]